MDIKGFSSLHGPGGEISGLSYGLSERVDKGEFSGKAVRFGDAVTGGGRSLCATIPCMLASRDNTFRNDGVLTAVRRRSGGRGGTKSCLVLIALWVPAPDFSYSWQYRLRQLVDSWGSHWALRSKRWSTARLDLPASRIAHPNPTRDARASSAGPG